jgi:uncharacterized membrane protein
MPKALLGLAGSALLIMIVSIPLMLERVPKNPLYGFRTNKSMSGSDSEWYRINRIAGAGLFIAGFISLIACLIVPRLIDNGQTAVFSCGGVLLVAIVTATVVTYLQQGR